MFHPFLKSVREVHVCNPPLCPLFVIEPSTNDNGDPINSLALKERDNKGLYPAHYDAATMSLRARLNLGIQLTPVSLGQTENDPNKLNATVQNFSQRLSYLMQQRQISSVSSSPSQSSSINTKSE